ATPPKKHLRNDLPDDNPPPPKKGSGESATGTEPDYSTIPTELNTGGYLGLEEMFGTNSWLYPQQSSQSIYSDKQEQTEQATGGTSEDIYGYSQRNEQTFVNPTLYSQQQGQQEFNTGFGVNQEHTEISGTNLYPQEPSQSIFPTGYVYPTNSTLLSTEDIYGNIQRNETTFVNPTLYSQQQGQQSFEQNVFSQPIYSQPSTPFISQPDVIHNYSNLHEELQPFQKDHFDWDKGMDYSAHYGEEKAEEETVPSEDVPAGQQQKGKKPLGSKREIERRIKALGYNTTDLQIRSNSFEKNKMCFCSLCLNCNKQNNKFALTSVDDINKHVESVNHKKSVEIIFNKKTVELNKWKQMSESLNCISVDRRTSKYFCEICKKILEIDIMDKLSSHCIFHKTKQSRLSANQKSSSSSLQDTKDIPNFGSGIEEYGIPQQQLLLYNPLLFGQGIKQLQGMPLHPEIAYRQTVQHPNKPAASVDKNELLRELQMSLGEFPVNTEQTNQTNFGTELQKQESSQQLQPYHYDQIIQPSFNRISHSEQQ
ncbi:hypothetical protein Mgra_00009854, partial [Meloidogyne graminicola]